MRLVFGLEKVKSMDQNFFTHKKHQRITLMVILFVEDYDADKLKQLIITRGINKIPKLSMRLVRKFYNLYWMKVPLSVSYNNISVLRNKFNNEQELINYTKEQVNEPVDYINDLPYTIELASFDVKMKRGAIIFKCDHLLTDALGIANLFALLSDNYSSDMFPPVIKPYKFNLWEYIVDLFYELLSLLYIPYFYYQLSLFKTQDNPFKLKRGFGKCNIGISKPYSLTYLNTIRNKLKVSFNDLILTAITQALYQICKDNGYEHLTELISGLPVGVRHLSSTPEELELTNKATGFLIRVPVVNDTASDLKGVSAYLKTKLKNIPLVKATHSLFTSIVELIPVQILLDFNENFADIIDFLSSNVPGPKYELYFNESRVSDIIGFACANGMKLFMPIVSYNNQFRVSVSANSSIDFDMERFLRNLDDALTGLY
jgi:hypothetical protein